jgi:hypothetical protein
MAAERPLPSHHLGTLHSLHTRGPTQPFRKGEIGPLLNRGLVEAAGPRGQFGMTYYQLTQAGKDIARNVNLSGGQYTHDPNAAPPAPTGPAAIGPDDPVPEGYMRMKSGKILRIAKG